MCACFTLPERNGVFAEVSCSDDVALLYRPLKQCNSIVIALDLRPAALQPRSPAASQSRRSRPRSCAVGWRKGGPYRSAAPPLRPHTHVHSLSLPLFFSLPCTLTQLQSCDTHHRFNHFPAPLLLLRADLIQQHLRSLLICWSEAPELISCSWSFKSAFFFSSGSLKFYLLFLGSFLIAVVVLSDGIFAFCSCDQRVSAAAQQRRHDWPRLL